MFQAPEKGKDGKKGGKDGKKGEHEEAAAAPPPAGLPHVPASPAAQPEQLTEAQHQQQVAAAAASDPNAAIETHTEAPVDIPQEPVRVATPVWTVCAN